MTPDVVSVGVLGTGRLGRELAKRLADSCQVVAWDADVKKAKQFTKQHNLSFAQDPEQLLHSDVLLLCLPAPAIVTFLRELPTERHYRCVFVNLATGLDTPWLRETLRHQHFKIIGVKLIGQFAAIRQCIPLTLVTSHDDPQDLKLLQRVFGPIGHLSQGKEKSVQEINRAATKLALQFSKQFEAIIRPYACEPAWTVSALQNVVVGTLLDYPPELDNAYTRELLDELAREELSFVSAKARLGDPLATGIAP
jgi:hypothetical protein